MDGTGWTDLDYAAALDWLAMARALLAAGAPVDPRLRTDGERLDPRLLSTLNSCGQDQFKRLLRTGATPLHIAAAADAGGVVALLLDGGAEPDAADATTATPLHYAAAGHSDSAAAVLAARGADVGAATRKGVTPLHASARRDAVSVVRVLLDHGADVGAQDRGAIRRCIVPRRATRRSRRPSCSTAEPTSSAGAHDGVTPLHVAALKDAGRVARVLPSHGVNVDARADDGVTALHVAAMKDASGIVVALVTHGADLNATHAAGQGGAALGVVGGRRGGGRSPPGPRGEPAHACGRRQQARGRSGARASLEGGDTVGGARSRHRGDGRRRRRLLPGCSVGNAALRRARADDDGWSVA